jgi:lipooligosaccharide transport system permease protein
MEGVSYLEYIAPGLIVASAMNGATFETTYNVFIKMHFVKTYDAITATPVNIEDAMLGEMLWAITRGVIYGTIFALVVAVFGLVHGWTSLLLVPIVVVTSALFAGIGLLFSSAIKVIDMYSFYYTLWISPLFLFSGIFFPVSGLPHWAQVAAWCTPLYHCVNLAKGAAHGTLDTGNLVDLVWVLAAAAAAAGWAIVRVRRTLAS